MPKELQPAERYEAAFRRAAIGIALLDAQGRLVEANPAVARMLGRPADQLQGWELDALSNAADAADEQPRRAELLAGRIERYEAERRMRRASGEWIWVRLTVSLLQPPDAAGPVLLATLEDVSAQKQALAALERAAVTDELTSLLNRRGFFAVAEQQLRLAARNKQSLVLIFLDLDGFKRINDTYGHAHGDEMIKAAAQLLRAVCRDSDVLARMGGDEFVVLTPETTEEGAAVLLERLELRIEAWNEMWNGPGCISFSIGTVQRDPASTESLEELLSRADRKMYQRKRQLPWSPGLRT